jgi:hypothetical protein
VRTTLATCLFVVASACSGSSAPSPSRTSAPPEKLAAKPVSASELTFIEGDDDLGMRLYADGRLQIKFVHSEPGAPPTETWRDAAILAATGEVTVKGEQIGRLGDDGTFVMSDGTIAFRIDDDALVVASKRITIDETGLVIGTNPKLRPTRVRGIDSAAAKRRALFTLGVAFGLPGRTRASVAAKQQTCVERGGTCIKQWKMLKEGECARTDRDAAIGCESADTCCLPK